MPGTITIVRENRTRVLFEKGMEEKKISYQKVNVVLHQIYQLIIRIL